MFIWSKVEKKVLFTIQSLVKTNKCTKKTPFTRDTDVVQHIRYTGNKSFI